MYGVCFLLSNYMFQKQSTAVPSMSTWTWSGLRVSLTTHRMQKEHCMTSRPVSGTWLCDALQTALSVDCQAPWPGDTLVGSPSWAQLSRNHRPQTRCPSGEAPQSVTSSLRDARYSKSGDSLREAGILTHRIWELQSMNNHINEQSTKHVNRTHDFDSHTQESSQRCPGKLNNLGSRLVWCSAYTLYNYGSYGLRVEKNSSSRV